MAISSSDLPYISQAITTLAATSTRNAPDHVIASSNCRMLSAHTMQMARLENVQTDVPFAVMDVVNTSDETSHATRSHPGGEADRVLQEAHRGDAGCGAGREVKVGCEDREGNGDSRNGNEREAPPPS